MALPTVEEGVGFFRQAGLRPRSGHQKDKSGRGCLVGAWLVCVGLDPNNPECSFDRQAAALGLNSSRTLFAVEDGFDDGWNDRGQWYRGSPRTAEDAYDFGYAVAQACLKETWE